MTDSSLTVISEVPHLPARPVDAHKGTFGKVLVIAGSLGMSGAAVLSGSGAPARRGRARAGWQRPSPSSAIVAGPATPAT